MSGLRTGQLARAAGVNRQTLRFYERRGLLPEPERTLGGHRLYPAETLTVLRVIRVAQRLGFSLAEITALLPGSRHRERAGAGFQRRAAVKLAEVEAKISDYQVMAATLRSALAAGCEDLAACARHPLCPLPFTSAAPAADGTGRGHAGDG